MNLLRCQCVDATSFTLHANRTIVDDNWLIKTINQTIEMRCANIWMAGVPSSACSQSIMIRVYGYSALYLLAAFNVTRTCNDEYFIIIYAWIQTEGKTNISHTDPFRLWIRVAECCDDLESKKKPTNGKMEIITSWRSVRILIRPVLLAVDSFGFSLRVERVRHVVCLPMTNRWHSIRSIQQCRCRRLEMILEIGTREKLGMSNSILRWALHRTHQICQFCEVTDHRVPYTTHHLWSNHFPFPNHCHLGSAMRRASQCHIHWLPIVLWSVWELSTLWSSVDMWTDARLFFRPRISVCAMAATAPIAVDVQIEIEMDRIVPTDLFSFVEKLFLSVPEIEYRLAGLVRTWHVSIVDDYRWPMHYVANEIVDADFVHHFSMWLYYGQRSRGDFSMQCSENGIKLNAFSFNWPKCALPIWYSSQHPNHLVSPDREHLCLVLKICLCLSSHRVGC